MIAKNSILRRIGRDGQGSLGFEFAIAMPILVTIMLGVLQFGMALHASGAMRNAMDAGLRYAKLDPSATAAQVYAETKDTLVGVDQSGITKLEFTRGTATNGASFGKLIMEYKMTPLMPFAPIPDIILSEEKQIYLQA